MAISSIKDFNKLYRSYYAALCYFSFKIVADADDARDIVEDVFAKLLVAKKEFTENDNMRAWLYTSTKHASLNFLKQEKHVKERQFEFTTQQATEEWVYDYENIRAEILKRVLDEIKKLPGHSGKIIELSYLSGMKNEQIAQQMGLSLKTVKNLKSIGLATLKTRIPSSLFLEFIMVVGTIDQAVRHLS